MNKSILNIPDWLLIYQNIYYWVKKYNKKIYAKIDSNGYSWYLSSLDISLWLKNKEMLRLHQKYYLNLIHRYVQRDECLNNKFYIDKYWEVTPLDSNKLYKKFDTELFPDYSYLDNTDQRYALKLNKSGLHNIENTLNEHKKEETKLEEIEGIGQL